MRKIPSTILDTDHAPAGARFALWREAISPTHEAALPDGSDPDRFSAYARGFNLGPCLAIETRVSEQVLTRTSRAVRADQVDSYVIRLQRRGRWRGDADECTAAADPGDVMVLDMARPSSSMPCCRRSICMVSGCRARRRLCCAAISWLSPTIFRTCRPNMHPTWRARPVTSSPRASHQRAR